MVFFSGFRSDFRSLRNVAVAHYRVEVWGSDLVTGLWKFLLCSWHPILNYSSREPSTCHTQSRTQKSLFLWCGWISKIFCSFAMLQKLSCSIVSNFDVFPLRPGSERGMEFRRGLPFIGVRGVSEPSSIIYFSNLSSDWHLFFLSTRV